MLNSRRIITRGVIDMATSAILSSEGYDYAGPMALCDEPGAADIAVVTKAVQEIGELAKASGAKVDKQLAAITEHTEKSDQRILALEQKILAGAGATGAGASGAGAVPNIGAQIAKSFDFEKFRNQKAWEDRPIPGSIAQIMKSVLINTGTASGSDSSSFPTIGQELPGGPFGFVGRRLSILAALTSFPVGTLKLEFPKLTENTDNAQVQTGEGDTKASTDLEFAMEILEMATIAHTLNASKQVLADSPTLIEFINQVMLFSALKKFENLIVSGNGTSDKVSGLLTQGTVYAPGSAHASDMIGEMLASLTALGFTPNLLILNAFDYFKIISARDANGRYLAGGWSAASPTSLWGVPTVPTSALAAGTVIGLDTSVVRVLDREQANLTIGYNNDDWARNRCTLVAELRGNLACQNPLGVNVMSIQGDSP